MKAAEAIILIAIFAAIVIFMVMWLGKQVIGWWKRNHEQHVLEGDVWHVDTDKQGQETVVQLIKAGEDAYYIGSIPISLPHYDYDERLTELRLEAHDKADSLNRRLLEA